MAGGGGGGIISPAFGLNRFNRVIHIYRDLIGREQHENSIYTAQGS